MINTERLKIRKFNLNDHTDYYEIFGNPVIAKFDDFEPITKEQAIVDVKCLIENYNNSNPEELEFAVELLVEKKVIGVMTIKFKEDGIYIGYHFNEKYHDKGFALEATQSFIPWLKKEYNKKIRAVTDPENVPSIKLLNKLGFHFDGPITTNSIKEFKFSLPDK